MTLGDDAAPEPSTQGGGNGMPPTVFLADPSAEAERIAQVLRTAGYLVADVPLSMLYSRIAVQHPDVVLLDADAEGALAEVKHVRELPAADGIDFVFFGRRGDTIADADDALEHDASGFFGRPVDIGGLLTKLRVLTGGPEWRSGSYRNVSTPPPSIPARASNQSLQIGTGPALAPAPKASSSSLPPPPRASKPPSVLPPAFPDVPQSPSNRAGAPASTVFDDPSRAAAMHGPISPELQRLLDDAEQRVAGQESHEAAVTPEEEIESVLPADVLAALDEPLDDESLDESAPEIALSVGPARAAQHFQATAVGKVKKAASEAPPQTQTGGGGDSGSVTTGARGLPEVTPQPHGAPARGSRPTATMGHPTTTLPTSSAIVTGAGTGTGPGTGAGSSAPGSYGGSYSGGSYSGGSSNSGGSTSGLSNGGVSTGGASGGASSTSGSSGHSSRPASTTSGASQSPKSKVLAEVIAAPIEFARLMGQQIRERRSGAVCLDGADSVRRIVLFEGDFVTAASGRDEENLLAFLVTRGDLPRSEGVRLSGKIPPFGRHAGAALVAHGHLSQDQLWSALRAHAEWVALLAMKVTHGSVSIENEPPGRLRGEPSVFGGTTGAAVFVDLIRRAYSADEAILALAGVEARIADGAHSQLIVEAALDPLEERLVLDARGGTLAQLLARSPEPDVASVVLALALLGVIEAIPPLRGNPEPEDESRDAEIRELDEEATIARVRARMQLVEEGDYFAVLGVSHDATGYEIRRAFLELRRGFEPARLLTPRLTHLVDDVKKIVLVLEEAYEILRDAARRERYRRAILATPRD